MVKFKTKFFICSNQHPRFDDVSGALSNRMVLTHFKRSFRGSAADPNLFEKIKNEASGVLNWALEGARMYLEDGVLESSPQSLTAQSEMDRINNPIDAFCDDRIVIFNEDDAETYPQPVFNEDDFWENVTPRYPVGMEVDIEYLLRLYDPEEYGKVFTKQQFGSALKNCLLGRGLPPEWYRRRVRRSGLRCYLVCGIRVLSDEEMSGDARDDFSLPEITF